MKTSYFVTPEEGDLARKMEAKLLRLPLSSGLLFVGVSVVPRTDSDPSTYQVWVGCHRDFDEQLMDPLVRVTLREEIESGTQLNVVAHRGLLRRSFSKPRQR